MKATDSVFCSIPIRTRPASASHLDDVARKGWPNRGSGSECHFLPHEDALALQRELVDGQLLERHDGLLAVQKPSEQDVLQDDLEMTVD